MIYPCRGYFKLIYLGARRCCELLWFVTCATKAKLAGICGSSHDPGGFALLVELTTGTERLACKGLIKGLLRAAMLSGAVYNTLCVDNFSPSTTYFSMRKTSIEKYSCYSNIVACDGRTYVRGTDK